MPEKFLQKQPVCVWCVQALSHTLSDGQEREFIYFYATFLLNFGQIQSKPEIISKYLFTLVRPVRHQQVLVGTSQVSTPYSGQSLLNQGGLCKRPFFFYFLTYLIRSRHRKPLFHFSTLISSGTFWYSWLEISVEIIQTCNNKTQCA